MRFQKLLPCILLITSLLPACAFADIELSAQLAGGFPTNNYSFVSSPTLLTGAQLTFGALGLEYGFAYEHNFLNYQNGGGSGSLNFYGGVIRLGTFTGLFADGQAGVSERDNSGTSFSWGVGGGYAIPISFICDLSPRFGYRSLPDSGVTRSMVDVGLLLTFKLL
jgi:hypothetical protein